MELKRKIAVGVLGVLAAGGIGVGTAAASPASGNPAAGITPTLVSYATPLSGEQPGDKAGKGI